MDEVCRGFTFPTVLSEKKLTWNIVTRRCIKVHKPGTSQAPLRRADIKAFLSISRPSEVSSMFRLLPFQVWRSWSMKRTDVLSKIHIRHLFRPIFLQNCKGRFGPVRFYWICSQWFPIIEAMVQNRYRSSRVLLASRRPWLSILSFDWGVKIIKDHIVPDVLA